VPFPRDSDAAKLWAHVNAPPPAGLGAVDAVIARGLAKDPADRYARAGELAEALGAAPARPPRRLAPAPSSSSLTVRAPGG